jgi:Tfp pilus assembly protein PilP
MRSVNTMIVGILLAAAPGLMAQTSPATGTSSNPPAKAASKPKTGKPKAAGTAKAKSAHSATPKAVPVSASAADVAAAQGGEADKGSRRDPFESLVNRQKDQNQGKNLPPGKAGLQVSTLRLDGIVRSSAGMIAVVSNPQSRTYFLREGDQLYDGRVDKIAMDGVSFHELGKDAFGKPVERQVQKRIYASAGEQQ